MSAARELLLREAAALRAEALALEKVVANSKGWIATRATSQIVALRREATELEAEANKP